MWEKMAYVNPSLFLNCQNLITFNQKSTPFIQNSKLTDYFMFQKRGIIGKKRNRLGREAHFDAIFIISDVNATTSSNMYAFVDPTIIPYNPLNYYNQHMFTNTIPQAAFPNRYISKI